MSNKKDAGRTILGSLELFNQAVVLFEQELEPEVRTKFAEALQGWADQHGWTAKTDSDDINEYWIAPPGWSFKEENGRDNANPWFALAQAEHSNSYALSDLFGVGSTSVNWWFCVHEKGLGFEGKRAWKKSFQAVAGKYAEHLNPLGVLYDEESFFLPLKLDPTKLADAWSDDDYDELFGPLIAALDILEKARPILDEMVNQIRQNQP
jgi:hypothetical protein